MGPFYHHAVFFVLFFCEYRILFRLQFSKKKKKIFWVLLNIWIVWQDVARNFHVHCVKNNFYWNISSRISFHNSFFELTTKKKKKSGRTPTKLKRYTILKRGYEMYTPKVFLMNKAWKFCLNRIISWYFKNQKEKKYVFIIWKCDRYTVWL